MKKLVERVGPVKLPKKSSSKSAYEALVQSVIYQQLAGRAADTIFGRFKKLFPSSRFPSAKKILATSDEKLRSAGLSGSKILAIKDIAAKFHAGTIPSDRKLQMLSNEEIVEKLTIIRGVGPWTVHMLLIFHLQRADVLPTTDYGVRKGFALAYKKKELPTPEALARAGEKWKPYRSAAAWYLWRALE